MGARLSQGRRDLEGQVAVVTGGGRGIGRAIALTLASAGMSVAIIARSKSEIADTANLIERSGGCAQAHAVDVADQQQVRSAMAQIERSLGAARLLVNNAAQIGPIGPFNLADLEHWWRAIDVNLRGAVQCTHALLPGMIARGSGRIVNIVASAIPLAHLSSYLTSKTALIRFTEIIAAELQPNGIQAFALLPGTVRTAMSEYSLDSVEGRKWLPWFGKLFSEGLDVPVERPANFVLALARGQGDALSGRTLGATDNLVALVASVPEIEANQLYSLRIRTLSGSTNPLLESIRAEGEREWNSRLRIERNIASPPAEVFGLWTAPQSVREWFVYQASVHWTQEPRIEPRPGGHYDWQVASDDNEEEVFHFSGAYREIKPGVKLSFTWNWQVLPIEGVDGPGHTAVNIEFFADGAGTKLVLTQTGLPSEAARTAHQEGWNRCIDGMEKLIIQATAQDFTF